MSRSGSTVTARDAGCNGTLEPGGSASFGFQATCSGTNVVPARYTLGGAPSS